MKRKVIILMVLCLAGGMLAGCKDNKIQKIIGVSQVQKTVGGIQIPNMFKSFQLLNKFREGNTKETFTWLESQEGGFYLLTPGKPKHDVQTVGAENIQIELNNYYVDKKDISYVVSYTEYPKNVAEYTSADKILDGARDGAVANINGKLIKETKISMDKYPGRELTIEVPSKQGKVYQRIYLADNRLYQVVAAFSKDKEKSYTKDMINFFNSFKITYKQDAE